MSRENIDFIPCNRENKYKTVHEFCVGARNPRVNLGGNAMRAMYMQLRVHALIQARRYDILQLQYVVPYSVQVSVRVPVVLKKPRRHSFNG